MSQMPDTVPTVKADSLKVLAPPPMTYEQLMAVFTPLRNTPEGTPLKEMQEKEKKLRDLRDKANYLLRYVVDPIKKKAAENKKLEKEAIEEQKKFNAEQLAAKEAEQQRREQMEAMRNSRKRRDRQMANQMENDSTAQAEEETSTTSEGSEGTAMARLETAEKELEELRKKTEPTEKLANIIRTEWAKLNTRIQTETDKAGEEAMKSFEKLNLADVYDVDTKQPNMATIDYYKENLFYSKKPYQINCKGGAGATLLKGIALGTGQNIQGCIGYVSSLNKHLMYNLIMIKLADGSVKAVLWGKNNEKTTTEDQYKAGAVIVF